MTDNFHKYIQMKNDKAILFKKKIQGPQYKKVEEKSVWNNGEKE